MPITALPSPAELARTLPFIGSARPWRLVRYACVDWIGILTCWLMMALTPNLLVHAAGVVQFEPLPRVRAAQAVQEAGVHPLTDESAGMIGHASVAPYSRRHSSNMTSANARSPLRP